MQGVLDSRIEGNLWECVCVEKQITSIMKVAEEMLI